MDPGSGSRVGKYVLSRFQSIGPIQQALTQGTAAAVIDGLLAVLILGVMFFYSIKLTLIALAAFALYALVRFVSFSFQREAHKHQRSPGFSPGKPNAGAGALRSLPRSRLSRFQRPRG